MSKVNNIGQNSKDLINRLSMGNNANGNSKNNDLGLKLNLSKINGNNGNNNKIKKTIKH
jgi:hypothetical protein